MDCGPADCVHTEGDASKGEADEEQPLATRSWLSSSQPVVAWERCSTDSDAGPDNVRTQHRTQLSAGSEGKASEEGEDTREEDFVQSANEDAEKTEDNKQEEDISEKLDPRGQDEMQENGESKHPVDTRSFNRGEETGVDEASERAMTHEDHQGKDESTTKIKTPADDDTLHHEDEPDLKAEEGEVQERAMMALSLQEDINEKMAQRDESDTPPAHKNVRDRDDVSLLTSENENMPNERATLVEKQHRKVSDDKIDSQMSCNNNGNTSEDELGQQHVRARGSEDAEDTEEEKEPAAVTEEEDVEEEESKITKKVKDSPNISIGRVTCSKEMYQHFESELHKIEFADGKREEMIDSPEVQPRTREDSDEFIDGKYDVTTTDTCVDGRVIDKDREEEEERLFSEIGNKERCKEATTSVTVKPEGETRQETSGEFKNIPAGIREGQRELNSPPCEEAQGGVPEHNNESGQDENTTQWFLEVRDYEEKQTVILPEEVDSKEPENIQNSSSVVGLDSCVEEDQESTGNINSLADLVVEDHSGILHHTNTAQAKESPLIESGAQELFFNPVKTGIKHPEKESEMHSGLTHQGDGTAKEPEDGTEGLLVESEIDEGICDFKEAVSAGDNLGKVPSYADETVKFIEDGMQKITVGTSSFPEGFSGSEFMDQSVETEPKSTEYRSVEMQEPNMEKSGYRDAEEAATDEFQNNHEVEILNLQVAAEVNTNMGNKLIEALEMHKQLSDEIRNEVTVSKSNSKDMSVISAEEVAKHVTVSGGTYTEETVSPNSGVQEAIDEEIIDMRIHTVLSEHADDIMQIEEPEPGQQMERKRDPLEEKHDDISSVLMDKKELVELGPSEESQFRSDTGMSSTTESRFLDLSLGESEEQSTEMQLLTLNSTGSFCEILVNMSEPGEAVSESQDAVMEESVETELSYLQQEESVTVTGHLNQELVESWEKPDEETEPKVEIDVKVADLIKTTEGNVAEEDNIDILTEMVAPFDVEETLEVSDLMENTESGQSRSSSEVSLEEGVVSVESVSQVDTYTETVKLMPSSSGETPQPGGSRDEVGALPGLERTDVVKHLAEVSTDQMEVLFPI